MNNYLDKSIRKCLTCKVNDALWNLSTCRDCFAKAKLESGKSLEDRILDLEIHAATPHSHVSNTIFG